MRRIPHTTDNIQSASHSVCSQLARTGNLPRSRQPSLKKSTAATRPGRLLPLPLPLRMPRCRLSREPRLVVVRKTWSTSRWPSCSTVSLCPSARPRPCRVPSSFTASQSHRLARVRARAHVCVCACTHARGFLRGAIFRGGRLMRVRCACASLASFRNKHHRGNKKKGARDGELTERRGPRASAVVRTTPSSKFDLRLISG